jgi:pyruvate formate lyase activating enzyme
MGYLVKLDTNGSFPDLLQRLIDAKLLNYIAMDIKTAPERYSVLTGVRNIDIGPVLASVDIIRNSGVEHEFRTTVVNELHSPADFERIGQWLKGEERYFLQLFVDSGALIGTGLSPASEGKMREYLSIVQKYIPTAKLRGI